jgi:pSer/pThr/pTyr-binding forkhead associated (FHA) protein
MDPYVVAIWIVRLAFLGGLYLFMFGVTRLLLRDLRAATRDPSGALARLVVVGSEVSEPPRGTVFGLDAVATIGRDVNNSIVVEDDFASSEHAALTFRGRAWYVEDLASTNGTFVNGQRIDGLSAIAYGDEVQVGRVRFRFERARR